jgi:hypothetical protein
MFSAFALIETRAQGRPGAGGTRSPACAKERARGGPQVTPGHPGLPCADGFNGVLRALVSGSPGSDALLPPSPYRWLMHAPGRAATSPQDLTHRPRASGPHDFSVRAHPHPHSRRLACAHRRDRTRTLSARCRTALAAAHGITALQPTLRADAVASTAPLPASRDDRETPLVASRDVSRCTANRISVNTNVLSDLD